MGAAAVVAPEAAIAERDGRGRRPWRICSCVGVLDRVVIEMAIGGDQAGFDFGTPAKRSWYRHGGSPPATWGLELDRQDGQRPWQQLNERWTREASPQAGRLHGNSDRSSDRSNSRCARHVRLHRKEWSPLLFNPSRVRRVAVVSQVRRSPTHMKRAVPGVEAAGDCIGELDTPRQSPAGPDDRHKQRLVDPELH